ncbi:Gametocyte-specific factor 1 like [Pseudolycoriella hygida]|uniref:Gametocyte-specific factor 1 like n=1 Tax=Pseudolycoriella hygida TaxID=35572 RepID=A0A9Q0N9N8_9DIPT|nr:Gametocyte-specific factor 1 like [Pseudolycoriella hygida]
MNRRPYEFHKIMSQLKGYEKTVKCPYNPSHLILLDRFQTHLVKCARNHPDIVLKKCPFNSCHLLRESEFEAHVLHCEDRASFDLYKYRIDSKPDQFTESGASKVMDEPESSEGPPGFNCNHGENWDDEDHPSYNPQDYVEKAPVLRTLNVATPSEKKAFREAERIRLANFED